MIIGTDGEILARLGRVPGKEQLGEDDKISALSPGIGDDLASPGHVRGDVAKRTTQLGQGDAHLQPSPPGSARWPDTPALLSSFAAPAGSPPPPRTAVSSSAARLVSTPASARRLPKRNLGPDTLIAAITLP